MAKKGALMVKLNKNGQEFYVVGTHLNAAGSDDYRICQLKQLKTELLVSITHTISFISSLFASIAMPSAVLYVHFLSKLYISIWLVFFSLLMIVQFVAAMIIPPLL